MLAGLQGSGKTTLAGKLGKWLKDQGHTPMLVAADLQRPNAVTQLEVVGERAGVPVFAPERGNIAGHDAVSGGIEGTRSFGDPVAVARAGVAPAPSSTTSSSSTPPVVSRSMRTSCSRPRTSAPPLSPTRSSSSSTR
jgi:cellulose biosynthesis protein BcsQ